MRRTKKKQPGDYPQFTFRISATEKAALTKKVEKLHLALNKRIPDTERAFTKNQIIIEALHKGLDSLTRNLK